MIDLLTKPFLTVSNISQFNKKRHGADCRGAFFEFESQRF
jgi:hypothetical protein